ncbi:hypothetical protein EVAR_72580_1, partial [Eumeta japonica]
MITTTRELLFRLELPYAAATPAINTHDAGRETAHAFVFDEYVLMFMFSV